MHSRCLSAAFKLLALTALLFALAPAAPAGAQDDLDISVFYEELEQHGRWFTHPRYGYVWSPDVDDDWQPYSRGGWIYTDDHGWYWEAEEPWGWGPFHYGRWLLDDEFGWVWIPGTEWGPAWVAWRYSDDDELVGWAPLPPEAEWYEDRGLTFSVTYYDSPRFAPLWIFVQPRYLVYPSVWRHALPRHRVVYAFGRTRWHNSYRVVNRRAFNVGFDVHRYERITRRPVARVRLVTSDSPRTRGFRDNDRRTLHTFRPRLLVKANPPRPPRLVDPPRRELRRQDGEGARTIVRPGFTPQDRDKDEGDSLRRKKVQPPDGDRRKDFARTPKDDDDEPRKRGLRTLDDDRRKDLVRTPKDNDDSQRQKNLRSLDDDRRKDLVRIPKDNDHSQRQKSLRPPDEDKRRDVRPPLEFRKQELRPPQTGLRTPDGHQGSGQERLRQREFRQQKDPPPQALGQSGSTNQGSGDSDRGRRGKKPEDKDGIPRR